jgi:hypothetical protein
MEQDLPMQQLSEMFNVNHFIISQANPHAVMFANYNQKQNVWASPLTGVANAMLSFLKNQVRSWISHLVECLGARRIAPFFDTERGVGMQFFTQEYEGRPSDISLIPWIGHRGLMSAMLHIIYNPSEAEFREWIAASERETWKYIPAIKSHIAEEVTLDRCVQRLRRQLMHEAWEKQKAASNEAKEEGMGRVPSFFTSASVVNLGGLGVADPHPGDSYHDYKPTSVGVPTEKVPSTTNLPGININQGWGGQGLRGNRTSSGNLIRSTSDASGLFIDEEEPSRNQATSEHANGEKKFPSYPSLRSKASESSLTGAGYVKSTSMAHFYYRKSNVKSTDSLLHKSTSDPLIEKESKPHTNERRKSKSHADLDFML